MKKKKQIEPTTREALSDLGIQQLDLLLVHLPIPVDFVGEKIVPARVPLYKVWEAMESLVHKVIKKTFDQCQFFYSKGNKKKKGINKSDWNLQLHYCTSS